MKGGFIPRSSNEWTLNVVGNISAVAISDEITNLTAQGYNVKKLGGIYCNINKELNSKYELYFSESTFHNGVINVFNVSGESQLKSNKMIKINNNNNSKVR